MFTPAAQELERGWPGRIEGETVVQLAAQTLQSFFTGGSAAREHAQYRLDDVHLRAPVLEPPAVRLFDDASQLLVREPERDPLAGRLHHQARRTAGRHHPPGRRHRPRRCDRRLDRVGGVAAPELAPPKDRDFALLLGPIVETELTDDFDWEAARSLAELNTRLRPGDLLAGPPLESHQNVASGPLELTIDGVGRLTANVS